MELYNMNYLQLKAIISKINYGYIDKLGNKHYNVFSNPTSNYCLQSAQQLLDSKIGLCFDIVELYREYLKKHKYYTESYYLEYKDDEIFETHAFIIFRNSKNQWIECIDNSWEGEIETLAYYDKETLLKHIYDWFQTYMESIYGQIDRTKFYFNKYFVPIPVLNKKISLCEHCKKRDYLESYRVEYSGMAIVFCKGKVLVLETKHNEFVFPKGHIEEGESSKDASIRECLEESGVSLAQAKYYGECGKFSYTFSSGHLKITNDDFYKTFKVNKISKTIFVHVYEIDNFQDFLLESIFIKGLWVDVDEVGDVITHDNTKDIFIDALKIYQNKNKSS